MLTKKFSIEENFPPKDATVYPMTAEHKRRHTMKKGFDHLESMLLETSSNPTKLSKAGILIKARDHINKDRIYIKYLLNSFLLNF